jgi:hypothetical protein
VPLDDALLWAVRAELPAALCFILGTALSLRAALRQQRNSLWGIRFALVGACLASLVPGLLILSDVVTGHLLWPAAFAGAFALAVGMGFVVVLRQNWTPRAGDPN